MLQTNTIQAQQNSDGSWTWFMKDGLGSVRSEVNAALEINASTNHTPYGEPVDVTGISTTSYGYTGEMVDDNDLVYLRARYYVPELGVFPSLDPVEFVNRYGYVGGNVANRVDPDGQVSRCLQTNCPVGTLVAGNNPDNDRCQISYSHFSALNWALNQSQSEIPPLRGQINGTLCVVFLYLALRSGGMPELGDPDSSSGYNDRLGLCHPINGQKFCGENARGVPFFGDRFLSRSIYANNDRYKFEPPVQQIFQEDALQSGDIIYQKVNTEVINNGSVSFDHVALFIGWGPKLQVSDRKDALENAERLRPDLHLTNFKISSEQIPWVIDEQTSAGHPPTKRPFRQYLTTDLAAGGYQQGITHIYRIPTTFTIHKGYLEASVQ